MALNLGKVFKKHGIAVSEQKSKLWGAGEVIAENLTSKDFDLYIKEYDDSELSAFVVVETEEGSRAIGFAPNEITDLEEYSYDSSTGKVKSNDIDFEINLGIVEALRDDEDLQVRDLNNDLVDVEEGIQTLKAYVA